MKGKMKSAALFLLALVLCSCAMALLLCSCVQTRSLPEGCSRHLYPNNGELLIVPLAYLPMQMRRSSLPLPEIKKDIEACLRDQYQPQGATIEYFAEGVSTFDDWLSMTYIPLTSPPDRPSFYRFIYRDGYPVADYRHDSTGIHLSSQVFYSKTKTPLISVNYASDGHIIWYSHLTYDDFGMIKRVVNLDQTFEPLFVTCFLNYGLYAKCEECRYAVKQDGALVNHLVYDGFHVYRVVDGEKTEINLGSRIWMITHLSMFGIRPLYPLPPDIPDIPSPPASSKPLPVEPHQLKINNKISLSNKEPDIPHTNKPSAFNEHHLSFCLADFEKTKSLIQLDVAIRTMKHIDNIERLNSNQHRKEHTTLWLKLFSAIDQAIDPTFDVTKPHGVTKLVPPPDEKEGPIYSAGVNPAVVKDPKGRAEYVAAINANEEIIKFARFQGDLITRKRIAVLDLQYYLKWTYTASEADRKEWNDILNKSALSEMCRKELADLFAKTHP